MRRFIQWKIPIGQLRLQLAWICQLHVRREAKLQKESDEKMQTLLLAQ